MAELHENEGGRWSVVEYGERGGRFAFRDNSGDGPALLKTPEGHEFDTGMPELAERILRDLERFGPGYRGLDSVVPWHFAYFDRAVYETSEAHDRWKDDVVPLLLRADEPNSAEGLTVRDGCPGRLAAWIASCTQLQLFAAGMLCRRFGNACPLLALSAAAEAPDGAERRSELEALARLTAEKNPGESAGEVLRIFETYVFYYGLHLRRQEPARG